MAPASLPEPPVTFLQNLNDFWELICGMFIGFITTIKIIWNVGRYFRGVDDKFTKLDADIQELHTLLSEVRQELFTHHINQPPPH